MTNERYVELIREIMDKYLFEPMNVYLIEKIKRDLQDLRINQICIRDPLEINGIRIGHFEVRPDHTSGILDVIPYDVYGNRINTNITITKVAEEFKGTDMKIEKNVTQKVIQQVVEENEYVVTLSEYQAQVLMNILYRVGGQPYEGCPRKVTEDLYHLLGKSGVQLELEKYETTGYIMIENAE